ncbi:hypothetical protein Rhopal_002237-T1 [Rhodotorula paludigena]|uniref:Uncharacterized protein n=1 Tax=Rhodotorula paludigena TaxID=86838 RepID=A0AAV5GKR8_9BASI|nr:hypothetical protein Rhopal_002237-T1 [Rhodotorula paludigena]
MAAPLVSSAYLAQAAVSAAARSAAASPVASTSRERSISFNSQHSGKAREDVLADALDLLDDDSDYDDDEEDLVDEWFLDPTSDEAILMKALAYCKTLSSIGQRYATDLPMRVLAVATGFTEALSSLSLGAGDDLVAPVPRVPTLRRRTASPPPASGTLTPAELETAHARSFGDSLLSGLSSLAASRAPTPPLERSRSASPSMPPLVSSAEHDPSATAAREELLQLYQFTAAGQHRHSTALDRLLENVAETARERRLSAGAGSGAGASAVEAAREEPTREVTLTQEDGTAILRVRAVDRGVEYVFEIAEDEDEVEGEDDETPRREDDPEAEEAERERDEQEQRVARRRVRDLVGR